MSYPGMVPSPMPISVYHYQFTRMLVTMLIDWSIQSIIEQASWLYENEPYSSFLEDAERLKSEQCHSAATQSCLTLNPFISFDYHVL